VTALICLSVALALRYVLNVTIGNAMPFITVFGATAAAQWYGGRYAATSVALLGLVGCLLMLGAAEGRTAFQEVGGVLGIAAFLFTSAVIIGFGEIARAAGAAAHDRSETLRITLHSIGDAVVTTDIHGRVTSLNAVAESLTGWTSEDATGRPLDSVFRIVNEGTRQLVESPAVRALREGTVVGLANHTLLIRRDGVEHPIDDSAAPIRDGEGRVSGCVLVFRDVTAQRQMERDRATQLQTARLLAAIVDSSDDAIVRKRLDGTIETWNAGAERLFGHRAADAIGRHITLVIPPERRHEEDQIIATLRAGRRINHFETERVRADGTRIWVSLTVSPIEDEHGEVVAASKIVRDVTERVRAEAEREKLLKVLENSQDFIGMCDLEGVPFFVNRAGLETVGLESLEQARETPLAEFFFPEDRPRIVDEFLPRVLRDGQGEIEIRFRHFKTGEPRWMAYKVLTLTDHTGAATGFATVSQDVTERKARADELVEADRRKNEFLAMLAHELRNPLAPLSNAVQAIKLREAGDEEVAVATGILDRQIRQMARLVNDLLDASRISRSKIEIHRARIALRPVLEEAIETVRPLVTAHDHTLTTELPSEPIYIEGDAGRLSQAVGNLLANAAKFTDKGGRIRLSASREGDEAVIRVRDNGIGIAPEHVDKLFELFVQVDTTIERSRDGLGIGLTLVKKLVDLHGGSIEVESAGPGQGSEFTVRLPALTPALEPQPTDPPTATSVKSIGRRVLVADDNHDSAESLALLLEFDGHEVHTAHDGAEAVATAANVRPDVVLMDIGLPIMNGYEACRRIRDQAWGASVVMVAITGWGQEEDRERSREAGFDLHLVKPVDHHELLRIVSARTPASA